MALPYLVKHIYNNGSEEVIRRGKKIHSSGYVDLMEYDELMSSVNFRVKDDNYSIYYKVYVTHFKDPNTLKLRCTCPYNLSEICRHKAGVLFTLQDLLDRNMLGERELIYDQKHTVVKMKLLDMKIIRMLSSPETLILAEAFLSGGSKAKIISAKEERVVADVVFNDVLYKIAVQKNDERNFDTSCTCNSDIKHPLCVHKAIIFLQLLKSKGANYFDTIRNWDAVKNKLLSLYGYSLSDDLKGKFEFTYTDGKPFLRLLDSSIQKIAPVISTLSKEPKPEIPLYKQEYNERQEAKLQAEQLQNPITPQGPVMHKAAYKLGLVLTSNSLQYPFVNIEVVQAETDEYFSKYTGKIEKLDLNKFINTEVFNEEDKMMVQQLRKFLWVEVIKYLNRNSPFSGIWENIVQQNANDFPEETRTIIDEYLHPKYKKLFDDLAGSNFLFYLPAKMPFNADNLLEAELSSTHISPSFSVYYSDKKYTVECFVQLPLAELGIEENECESPMLFQYHNQFFTWERTEDVAIITRFLPTGKLEFIDTDWEVQLQNFIIPLTKTYNVNFGNIDKEEIRDVVPDCKVLLKEKGDYLILEPIFSYKGYEIKQSDKEKIILAVENKILVIQRNLDVEKEFIQRLESLHSNFIKPEDTNTLALKGVDVLKDNWFFLFIDAVKDMSITIYGFDALKHFRFNTAKPSTKIFISSNTDWFDAKVEITFGGQQVTVEDIKKALASKQQYVQLADGSLGILPDEWIKKYSLLFRVGEGKATNIKLSKYHFSVIEELYNERNEEELFFQMEAKYDKLKQNFDIKEIDPPSSLQAVLRPYQESGFRWLNYLRDVQWGGILADDMGLGKTIQALSYISFLKEKLGALKALVVCPTTLMYNWQNEIIKFTPNLSFYIHHGGSRLRENLQQDHIDIIITTYGTLRSDIKQFVDLNWDYVVLDESQAIKNPGSKVAKAACLLRADNRLCLSGTPLQNNTFDIFAQMNFLNPGMLGSVEFFKQEFAVPIDKFGEKEQKEHLRKLLYPFILRRTKEQVAKDLPEKQEMVLFCEMGAEQRRIYDAFRNDFREKILGVVDTQGVGKSQLTILQGLMKLRQICDSPYIMNEQDRYPNVSVKLEEIGREITENISNHKALIFSQFLGMLALIKAKLRELEVPFEYFDGSTTAIERERAIQNFQNNDECRVFLISLKAGGVGLNLTAADYVYIVDPWWNPAVEQQAIDRTHRIGQTKNVFAYRMICTDTVEDKILKLQERKKALARDLITDDEGFVKSLSREDVEYLFS